jgi:membrane-bound lytic murein transglycosylase D
MIDREAAGTGRGDSRPLSYAAPTVLLLVLVSALGCTAVQPRQTADITDVPVEAAVEVDEPAQEAGPAVAAGAVEFPTSIWPLEEGYVDDEVVLAEVAGLTESPLDELADIAPEASSEALEVERGRAADGPATFDIPIEINDQVLTWVDLYSRRMKSSTEASLRRSGRYSRMFREIFREAGLPQDLVYMAHVESGYKTSAYSRAHARGVFQFISATGRRYGLRVDYWVDERADPEKSARAAAAYMKDLYEEFGDWYLALAAYNAGEGKIRRAIARSGRDDFWGIAETHYIKRETKNHVPAIVAATLLSKEPEKYGLEFDLDPEVVYDTLTVDGAVDLRVLARCAGSDLETLRELNPALRRLQTPPDGTTDVRLPLGSATRTAEALELVPVNDRVIYARHRVRSGDTLSTIAHGYGVGVRAIQDANGMGRRTLIRVNQVLLVPTSTASAYAVASSASVSGDRVSGEVVVHSIRRGDTLYDVARRYRTTPTAIASASGIPVNKTLRIGGRLNVVPGVRDAALARSIASGSGSDSARVYTVRRGDTLWQIANLHRTSVTMLCALNKITPSAVIHPGTRLTVRLD